VLAQELAVRGVTVNTILPTAIEDAGVFTDADPNHPVRCRRTLWVPNRSSASGDLGIFVDQPTESVPSEA
jgi:NAD(P)-dependent dehydrogenase (short-subunit alcohol dehydrogenase family)